MKEHRIDVKVDKTEGVSLEIPISIVLRFLLEWHSEELGRKASKAIERMARRLEAEPPLSC
jgi:hypothetical protein